MSRIKSIAARRHRKIKLAARGFKHARKRRVKTAKEALLHAGQYAYAGRKLKRRDLRKLWITRLNASVREQGISYSVFISLLKKKNIELDRKILAELAVKNPEVLTKIISEIK